MKAIAITPGKGDVHLIDIVEPAINDPDEVKLRVIEVGICGTDREEVNGGRADAPAGSKELIIGHEMLGRVVETGRAVTKVKKGDYALFMVRRPCNHCYMCQHDRSDMCSTGDYTERGIKGRHGFQAEYVVDREEYLINVPDEISGIGALTEPTSVVEKAIHESFLLQSARMPVLNESAWLMGKRVLVSGIGPIGLMAAFILKIKGADVFGLDIVDNSSPRPSILKEIGGKYINGNEVSAGTIDEKCGEMDFILEATGIASLEFQLIDALGRNGIYALTGIPSGDRPVTVLGNDIMRDMVLMNQVLLGSVNAGKQHYIDAVDDLVRIGNRWGSAINRVITARVPYSEFRDILTKHSQDEIKVLIKWSKND
jgi:threonine dehydrogenase-like Zn-dependent dehydrogenase